MAEIKNGNNGTMKLILQIVVGLLMFLLTIYNASVLSQINDRKQEILQVQEDYKNLNTKLSEFIGTQTEGTKNIRTDIAEIKIQLNDIQKDLYRGK